MKYETPMLAPLIGGVGLLEQATGYLLDSLQMVTPRCMSNPTPCSEWDIRALLGHLDDSLEVLAEAADWDRVLVYSAGDEGAGTDLVEAVRDRATEVSRAWARAEHSFVSINGLPLTSAILVGTGALEVTVHGWDIARACGRYHGIPAELAEDLLALSRVLVCPADRPVRFAAPVLVPPMASASDRLVAFLGRCPR